MKYFVNDSKNYLLTATISYAWDVRAWFLVYTMYEILWLQSAVDSRRIENISAEWTHFYFPVEEFSWRISL